MNTVSFLSIPAGIVPDQEAVVCEGARFSYADTWTRVRRLAGALAARGVGPGTRVAALHDTVAARPRIAAYLASDRRIPFNQQGIFRHYPALDAKRAR